jgi:hypothetical protein
LIDADIDATGCSVPAALRQALERTEQVAGKILGSACSRPDVKQGDATLNAMDPPVQQGVGKRRSAEFYEVDVEIDN